MSIRHAWAFLTRLPGGTHPANERGLGMSVPWFPAVGAMIGLVLGLFWIGLNELVAPLMSSTITVMLGVVITGAFHEDGFADTADSLGGFSPERRLEIMRDSRVGTFGSLALIFSVLVRVIALAELGPIHGLIALVLAHSVGRSLATLVMATTPPAAKEGLGQSYTAHLPKSRVFAMGVFIAACSVACGPAGLTGYMIALAGAGLVVIFAKRSFGGTTGDVLGAVEQIGEMAMLTTAARLVAEHGWQWG